MQIKEILEEKQKVLKHYGLPASATFTLDDINVLSDKDLLRAFKLVNKFPKEFERSRDSIDCVKRIVAGDSIYRVLEFCIIKNRILREPVSAIFPRLGDANDRFH